MRKYILGGKFILRLYIKSRLVNSAYTSVYGHKRQCYFFSQFLCVFSFFFVVYNVLDKENYVNI